MLEQYHKRLTEVKERKRLYVKWSAHKERAITHLTEGHQKAERLRQQLERERADVERLKKLSFTNLFYTIVGRRLEKMEKEQQELLQAQLKYEEALHTIEDLEEELKEIQLFLQSLSEPEQEYEQLIMEKKAYLISTDSPLTEQLSSLIDDEEEKKAQLKEYQEAITAGIKAKASLGKAVSSLESASGWSTWDMFGGGMLSTAIKHSHVDEARSEIHHAQRALRHFEEELKDVNAYTDCTIEIDGFLTFADYFFDGFIVDWMVHGKIQDSLSQTTEMVYHVERILRELTREEQALTGEITALKQQRTELVELA
ncbi:hypothetical protein M3212_08200 [Alkalihalobacillus oceani]|uniref:hypothetical protein n=1 Tax=Halalkalibacter oceani TaxID=1653776 RepID=UPI00203F2FA6|nr:hypothetical protein [Halalkalibacter oceani]MCM3760768.1 hypothetical protein [Halalkalibacter oceani]